MRDVKIGLLRLSGLVAVLGFGGWIYGMITFLTAESDSLLGAGRLRLLPLVLLNFFLFFLFRRMIAMSRQIWKKDHPRAHWVRSYFGSSLMVLCVQSVLFIASMVLLGTFGVPSWLRPLLVGVSVLYAQLSGLFLEVRRVGGKD